MFCPTCGKDNSLELRFCASCGTNLEAVSQALTGTEGDFFAKMDAGIDQFIGRYTEHVFKNPVSGPMEYKVARSWQLLGKAVLTSLIDILLFTLMWNLLPLRFVILLISTPFRLLSERSKDKRHEDLQVEAYEPPELSTPAAQKWLSESVVSVTENTTVNLGSSGGTREKAIPITDQLK